MRVIKTRGDGTPLSRRVRHQIRKRVAWLAIIPAATLPLFGQLPAPRLDSVFPSEVQAGGEIEVTLGGNDLSDVTALLCSAPGVTASKIDGVRFRVVAANDCTPGLSEARAVTRLGITNARPFLVGTTRVTVKSEKNQQLSSATRVEVPCVVHGRLDAEQRDYYRFHARAAESLQIACAAFQLDSTMDPVITVLDSSGRLLQRADDECDRDAALVWTPPLDGEYFVAVYDKMFAGGAGYAYRLSIATKAHRDLLFPAGPEVASEPWGACEQIAEVEPNNEGQQAQPIPLPVEVRGRLDTDCFVFDGDPSQPLWIDVATTDPSANVDPFIVIEKISKNAQGEEQAKLVLELDDQGELQSPPFWQSGSRNPSGKFVPDEKTRYRLFLRDRFGGNSEYCLRVTNAVADFSVIALAESPANEEKKVFRWQPNMRQDGSAYFHVAARRRNYDGEIALGAIGLPEGIRASGAIAAGASTGLLVFHAEPGAKPWAGAIRVFGDGGGIMHEARCMSYRWPVDNRDNQRLAPRMGGFAIALADEAAPITIRTADPRETWEAAIGSKLEIPLQLTFASSDIRAKGEWQIVPVGCPGLKKIESLKVDTANAKEAKLVLNFQKDGNTLQPGTFVFWPRANGTVSYKENATAKARDFKHVEFGRPIRVRLTDTPTAVTAVK